MTNTPDAPFGCVTCKADPTHLHVAAKSLHCTTHKPDGADELCQSCRPRATDRNHPPGMIFIGWGHGWQPCQSCGGSGLVADESLEALRAREKALREDLNSTRAQLRACVPEAYRCTTPMCGESGICEECRKRGAR